MNKECHFPIIKALVDNKKRSFLRRIILFFTFRRKFEVQEDYIVWSNYLQKFILIPKGFIFDGASVPKILGLLYQATGMLFYGASVHDFGYRYMKLIHVRPDRSICVQDYTKSELDKIFDDLCASESGLPLASAIATFALTLFGFTGWLEARARDSHLDVDFPEVVGTFLEC